MYLFHEGTRPSKKILLCRGFTAKLPFLDTDSILLQSRTIIHNGPLNQPTRCDYDSSSDHSAGGRMTRRFCRSSTRWSCTGQLSLHCDILVPSKIPAYFQPFHIRFLQVYAYWLLSLFVQASPLRVYDGNTDLIADLFGLG